MQRKRALRKMKIADQKKKLSTDDVIATVADGAAVGGMVATIHASLSPILALALFIAESLTQLGIPQIGPNPAFDYEVKCLRVGSLAGAGYNLYSLFSERNKPVENDQAKALPKSRFW